MDIIRVDQVWQLALALQIRVPEQGAGINKLKGSFNEDYNSTYNYVLLMENGQAIGTCRLNFNFKEYAKIERVEIVPSVQFKGYGRKMIEEAEQWIREKGFSKIVIHSMYSACGFYDKLSYKKETEVLLPMGPDNHRQVYYEKELK